MNTIPTSGARSRRDTRINVELFDAFQRRLVPDPHPPSAVVLDERYRPGSQGMQLGGDFLDAIELPDGALGFVIGDVSGHDANAAAFGVALRAGWKALAVATPDDPLDWLNVLEDAFFADGRFDGFVTALVGRIVPKTRDVILATAGHCWPVKLDGDAQLIEMKPGLPLGLGRAVPRRPLAFTLGDADRLLVYTDGLIENRKRPDANDRWGEDGLLEWLRSQPGGRPIDLDALLAHFGPDGFADDVAVMLLGIDADAL
ncbi:MAG TPA: PP2C family protein-serine/threonine phosphatase [Acidimicrobiales bacterium]